MITTTCTVTRRNQEKIEIPMDDLVVGDIVHLSAGDMIPADVRILDAKDLFVGQASLTGESEPIEKKTNVSAQKESVTDYTNIAFMGSNVISGSATAVVVCVGDHTLFGSMASAVAGEAVETSFTKGVNAVSWVLIRFYARYGSAGVLRQRHHQGRLVGGLLIRNFYCCRFDTGNAADDCNNLSCERCCFHEQEADNR